MIRDAVFRAAGNDFMANNLIQSVEASVRRVLIRAGVLSLFVNLLVLTGPLYMLQIYDRVLSSRSYETLFFLTLIVLVLFAAMALIDAARGALLSRAGEMFERRLRRNTFDRTLDSARSGAPNADLPLTDLRQIRRFVASPALTAVFDAPWTPLFLAIVYIMHPLLGLVATFGLIILLGLAIFTERTSRVAEKRARERLGEADRMATAIFRNVAAADAMGMRQHLRHKWESLSRLSSDDTLSGGDRIGSLSAISKATRLFLQSAILGTGAYLAVSGIVTPGVMIAASIIAARALAPVEIITSQWRNFRTSIEAYRRFQDFLQRAPENPQKTQLPAPTGAVEVVGLSVRPGNSKRAVLKNISFKLQAGEALGVVGPSAAGKSTLARAIVGVVEPIAGEVRLDAANIAHWENDKLGEYIGLLPQEVELFAGTAAQNISRFRPDVDHELIIKAAMAAGAHEMICGFPDGYDTEIGLGGAHLSAGQRQRLGLARALFGDPALVVLDEPNANLDGEGESALAGAVHGLKGRGTTVIIIAHRPSTIAFVDTLVVLENGQMKMIGPRDEVLKQILPQPQLQKTTNINEAAGARGRS